MPEPISDTIFALSSGRGPAAIAVVRISGSEAGGALKALIGKLPAPRETALARVRDPQTKEAIDQALALWFPGPNSETGEDIAELQLHGGRAVVAATLAALARLPGLRPAEAGEFTRRAFENGKLDLTAVEGLADLVMAETEGQRRQALRQLMGALGSRAEQWRQKLIAALALMEARIDFSDEADVPDDLVAPALAIARELEDEIAVALADGSRGERLRDGLVVAIAGPPNAGKSTLLNRLAQREAAIVSPYVGTTRDVIEVHLGLGGWPVTLLDTAGIRDSDDPVEMEGVRRARERAGGADVVLWVVDATEGEENAAAQGAAFWEPDSAIPDPPVGLSRSDQRTAPAIWLVRNKIDRLLDRRKNESRERAAQKNESGNIPTKDSMNNVSNELNTRNEFIFIKYEQRFNLSALTGDGFDALLAQLAQKAETFLGGNEATLITRARHRHALEQVMAALHRARSPDLAGKDDLLAEELRLAAQALGRLTGRVDVEDVLDVIFRDFCIGK